MFTGLIQATGTIQALEQPSCGTLRLTVHAPALAPRLREGDSVAVSGVCLTAIGPTSTHFTAELAQETIARTSLSHLAAGSVVNLELPTPAGAPLGGHVVQGHVDATGTITRLDALQPGDSRTDWWLEIEVPASLTEYIVEKGSIAIEGISLTIARWQPLTARLGVAVIPHTWDATNLHTLRVGSPVNLEADVLIKLAVSRATPAERGFSPTLPYLIANGY